MALLVVFVMYMLRAPILAVEFGSSYRLMLVAALPYALAVWISLRLRHQLTFRVFVGARADVRAPAEDTRQGMM